MSFFRVSGPANIISMQSAASTALNANSIVVQTAGVLANVASTGSLVSGILLETRASTDGDYATARPTLVDVLDENCQVMCDAVVGTLTKAMEGQFLKLSSTTGVSADAATATDTPAAALVLQLVTFISATQGIFKVNGLKQARGAA